VRERYARVVGTRCTESTRGARRCGYIASVAADGARWLDGAKASGCSVSAWGDVVFVVVEIIASDVDLSCITLDPAERLGSLASVGGRSWDVLWP
jgi:hypothetical protein